VFVDSCFGDEFVKRVGAKGEKGGETRNGGSLRCAGGAHDYGKDVDFGTWSVASNGIGEGGVFFADQVSCVGEIVVCALSPFPYLNLFNRGVTSAAVCVTGESMFE
jgi:hypothetical protein